MYIEMLCHKEAFNDEGEKVMQFTKGASYLFTEIEEGCFEAEDDNGDIETFFNVNIMFERT